MEKPDRPKLKRKHMTRARATPEKRLSISEAMKLHWIERRKKYGKDTGSPSTCNHRPEPVFQPFPAVDASKRIYEDDPRLPPCGGYHGEQANRTLSLRY